MEIFFADFQLNCLPPLAALPDDDRRPQRDDSTCAASLSCIASDTIAALPSVADFLYFMISISCRILFSVAVCFFYFIPIIYSYIIKREPQLLQNFKPISGGSKKKFIDDDKKPSKPRMLHHDRQHVDDERRKKSIDRREGSTMQKQKVMTTTTMHLWQGKPITQAAAEARIE